MQINLLDFFRTASFGTVKVGFQREKIESILGEPTGFLSENLLRDCQQADLWFYDVVELGFDDLEKDLLSTISFKPFYFSQANKFLDFEPKTFKLDLWIFRQGIDVTIDDLRLALNHESIPFQDTGLETSVFSEEMDKFATIPYDPELVDNESFGTLILQSGVQIRYSDNKSILRVASGLEWLFKGSEQDFILNQAIANG